MLNRSPILLLPVLLVSLLAACATGSPESRMLVVDARSAGQPLAGAGCVVHLGPQTYTVTTPATLPVGDAHGDLQITCNKPGYRTSELYFRATSSGGSSVGIGAGGGGGNVGLGLGMSFPIGGGHSDYPPRVTVEMTAQ